MQLMLILWLMLLVALPKVISAKKVRIKAPKGTKWWSLANSGERSNTIGSTIDRDYNPSLLPLTKRQRKLVTRNPGTNIAIVEGAQMAVAACRHQFKNRRWNCPTFFEGPGNLVFGKIIHKGYRETAFIHAITSAAVTHSVARACADGSIRTCSCGTEQNGQPSGQDWDWSGCSDNARFGNRFSRRFVDVHEKGHDFRYMMNLHNNEAGREHVKKSAKKACKCHGMSGNCTIKTCWMMLTNFKSVGRAIKDRFDGASKVLQGNDGQSNDKENSGHIRLGKNNRGKRKRRFHFTPADPNLKRIGKQDLVYLEESPNFCYNNTALGFPGTKGRECDPESLGTGGCDLMCCGRGYKTKMVKKWEQCQCYFEYCCKVHCKQCLNEYKVNICL